MIFNRLWARAWVQVLALLATLLALAWCLTAGYPWLAVLLAVVVGSIGYSLYQLQARLLREVQQFAEAIRYRDFSRYFTTHQTPADLRAVRQAFNEVISSFKAISHERETQYQYLQNVLELVDTGIFSYHAQTGDILWANDTIRRQLLLPYLKNLSGLTRRYPDLAQRLHDLKPGERQVIALQPEKATVKLLFSATVFQTDGQQYRLIACQNISEALDETESRAWQRLLSVMTHEIMNSVAPISSLADTLQGSLAEATRHLPDPDGTFEDLLLGIDTIKRRSAGLLKFASTYRSLSKVATPDLRLVRVRELFDAVQRLMQPTLQEKGIALHVTLADAALTIEVDPSLIEQVLINLLLNAIDAVRSSAAPHLTLAALLTPERHVALRISDNGEGIAADVLENIFVPFFTTKKTGSGIGLSLCKQIMLLHRGSIQVQSVVGQGSAFTLVF